MRNTAVETAPAHGGIRRLTDAGATGIFAGGSWQPASRSYVDRSPIWGTDLAEVADTTSSEVDDAVSLAQAAWPGWREVSARERAKLLRRFAAELASRGEELAVLDAVDGGNPLGSCRRDVATGIEILEYFAGLALELKGETMPTAKGALDFTLREPFGIVARITPFNHPALFACKAIAAPVTAGNVVFLKPSPHTPLSAMAIVGIANEVFPPGVVNLVTGGSDSAIALARNPHIRRLAVTGSYQAGLAVTRAAAEQDVKTVTLECGGKNPMIVLPDADVDGVVRGAVQGMNFTSCAGQSCGSTSRLLIHQDLYHPIVERVAQTIGALRLGDPLQESTQVGPMISEAQRAKTERYVDLAKRDGARVVVGGARPSNPQLANGHFYLPTLIDNVSPTDAVAREEVFGPLLAAVPWTGLEDVARIANDVEYGLTAAIWTADLDRAIWLAKALEAGYIWVNGSSEHEMGSPFGGYKNSGTGREESLDELLSYSQTKNVNLRYMRLT